MNIEHLKSFVNTFSESASLEMIIGAIALTLFYWNRFNSWTKKEAKYGSARPPRQFTTWARFMIYSVLYTLSVVGVYVLLVNSPHLLEFIGQLNNNPEVIAVAEKSGHKNFPLWVVVFLVGFLPHMPVLKQIEESYRNWFHQRAFIPEEAKALVNQFVNNPAFFKPDDKMTSRIIHKYGQSMPQNWEGHNADNRLRNKWFRLLYLLEKIEDWRSERQIVRYVAHCEKEFENFQEQFKKLRLEVKTYYQHTDGKESPAPGANGDEYLGRLKININQQTEELLHRVYEFITCGVLSTERIHSRRLAKLRHFGLYPTYEPGIPIVMDIVLKNAVAVFMIAAATSTAYLVYLRRVLDEPPNIAMGLVWAVIALLMIGLSIFCAVVLYRYLTRKSRFDPEKKDETVILGPFVHQCIAFVCGYFCGLVVLFPYFSVGSKSDWVTNLSHALPWPLLPAISASFVVYHLASLSDNRHKRKDALIQGLCTGAMGLLSCVWAFNDLSAKYASMVYIITTCAFIGAEIGYFFPKAYYRRVSALYRGQDRRRSPRIQIAAQSAIQADGHKLGCEVLNLSVGGARLNSTCDSEVGDRIKVDLPGVGKLNSRVVRKGENETAVAFQFDKNPSPELSHYIGNIA